MSLGGSGAPLQQSCFMWQCGHNHLVEIGSNSFSQYSQGMRPRVDLAPTLFG
jgi:hypothetical protein